MGPKILIDPSLLTSRRGLEWIARAMPLVGGDLILLESLKALPVDEWLLFAPPFFGRSTAWEMPRLIRDLDPGPVVQQPASALQVLEEAVSHLQQGGVLAARRSELIQLAVAHEYTALWVGPWRFREVAALAAKTLGTELVGSLTRRARFLAVAPAYLGLPGDAAHLVVADQGSHHRY